jgi:SH3-like domain-containing protein
MPWYKFLALWGALGLGVWGCATPGPTVAPTPVEREAYFYVGAKELDLRTAPEPQSSVSAQVTLNERVKKIDQSPKGWFKVETADGRTGWASEKYFKLDQVLDFYVSRWVRLRAAPDNRAKSVARLRVNDQVKLLDPHPRQGWAQVQAQRDQQTGWIELRYLSLDRVVVRRRIRRAPTAAPEKAAEEAAPETAEEAPAKPSILAPAPAKAAPPAKKTPPARKARPEMFDRF